MKKFVCTVCGYVYEARSCPKITSAPSAASAPTSSRKSNPTHVGEGLDPPFWAKPNIKWNVPSGHKGGSRPSPTIS